MRRAFSTNGATAFTSCVSSSSTVETSASRSRHELRSRRSTCWRSWSSRPSGNRSRLTGEIVGEERAPAISSAGVSSTARRAARRAASPSRRRPSYVPSSASHLGGHVARGLRLAVEHVAVELGRAPHGLARVVDDEVEPVARRLEVVAERLDARGVAQVEPEDLEPVAPVAEVAPRARSAPRRRAGIGS